MTRFVDQPQLIYHRADVSTSRDRILHLTAYDIVDIWLYVTALAGAPGTADMEVKVQHKAPRIPSDVTQQWVDIAGATVALDETTGLPFTGHIQLSAADLGDGEHLLVITVAFTGGASPSWHTFLSVRGRG